LCKITKQEGEVGMAKVGDRVELAAAKVERRPRSGVVTAVRGPMITVRWDTGEQSTVVPASGTLSVLGHKAKSTGQTAKKATKKAASRVAKAVEGRSAKAAKAVERGGARASKSLKKSAGRAAKAVEARASKAEKAVDRAASKAAGRARKSRKRAR
jgi:hypothetical protein